MQPTQQARSFNYIRAVARAQLMNLDAKAMRENHEKYKGIIYTALNIMITRDGPMVLRDLGLM